MNYILNSRIGNVILLLGLMLVCVPAFAQIDFSGD